MAANGNGSFISEKSKFSWTVLLAIVGIAMTLAAFGYSVQAGLAVHCANSDVHHPTAQLNDDYADRDLTNQQYQDIKARLDRIETKLDRLQ